MIKLKRILNHPNYPVGRKAKLLRSKGLWNSTALLTVSWWRFPWIWSVDGAQPIQPSDVHLPSKRSSRLICSLIQILWRIRTTIGSNRLATTSNFSTWTRTANRSHLERRQAAKDSGLRIGPLARKATRKSSQSVSRTWLIAYRSHWGSLHRIVSAKASDPRLASPRLLHWWALPWISHHAPQRNSRQWLTKAVTRQPSIVLSTSRCQVTSKFKSIWSPRRITSLS